MSGVWTAAAGIGSAVIGGISASNAAHTQARAAQNAQNLQQQMWSQQAGWQQPYREAGNLATSKLNFLLGLGNGGKGLSPTDPGYGSLNTPFSASMMQQYSPAYQFQKQQGMQGVLNTDAGTQGALSGASLKDLTSFNQGFANTAWGNAFNQYTTQQQNLYGRLSGIMNTGQAAASNAATGGSTYAGNIAQSATNVGTALGAGEIGVGNALSGGAQSASMPWLYANMKQAGLVPGGAAGGGGGGGGGTTYIPADPNGPWLS